MTGPLHSSWKYYTGLGTSIKKNVHKIPVHADKTTVKNKTQLETTLDAEQEKTI